MSRSEVEDGSGWEGLVESAQERREREARERELRQARAQGRAEGLREAYLTADGVHPSSGDSCCFRTRQDVTEAILALIPEAKE